MFSSIWQRNLDSNKHTLAYQESINILSRSHFAIPAVSSIWQQNLDSNKCTSASRKSINIFSRLHFSLLYFRSHRFSKEIWIQTNIPGLSQVSKYLGSIALFNTGGVINLPMYTGFSRVIYSTPHSSVILVSFETRLVSRETRGGKFPVSSTVLSCINILFIMKSI